MSLQSEIHEQPAALRRLLETQTAVARQIADDIRHRDIRYIFIAARGSSDNTGIYAKYLWGAFNHLPVALAAPSLFTVYEQPPRLRDALVLAISQSGQSPDIVSVLAEGRRQGALTVALTNDPSSPLASSADWVLDISAGREQAIAATKTYTTSLMAVAMLSVAMDDKSERAEHLARIPDAAALVLEESEAIERRIASFREMNRCVVIGRGFSYTTAFEWALKLKELSYVAAEPYSSADFRHGPIAMVEPDFPVLAIAPSGPALPDMLALLKVLANKRHARLAVISDDKEMLSLAHMAIRLPDDLLEWATPLVSIIPAQLFCFHLAHARGIDPDSPRGLVKVTETF